MMNINRFLGLFILALGLLWGTQRLMPAASGIANTLANPSAAEQQPDNKSHAGPEKPKSPTRNRLVKDLEDGIESVLPLLNRYGYPAVFVAVLVEGFGLVAPGQTLLMAASFTAASGGLNLILVLLLAFTGAVLGNSLGYLLGLKGGRPLLNKLRVHEERLQRLEGYFNRYGKGVVVVARFFDGLRQLNGIVAGLLRMPWKTFTICNILGAAIWTGVWGLGSYLLEKEIAKVHLSMRMVEPIIVIGALLAVLIFFIYVLWPTRKTRS
jgi:membrane protein DedA with SNARE-associated domain